MTVKDMLDDIYKNPTKETIEKYAVECLNNAVVLMKKNAVHFRDLDKCILDATRQFQVLQDCINEDEDALAQFEIKEDVIDIFKNNLPTEYDSIKREIAAAANE